MSLLDNLEYNNDVIGSGGIYYNLVTEQNIVIKKSNRTIPLLVRATYGWAVEKYENELKEEENFNMNKERE